MYCSPNQIELAKGTCAPIKTAVRRTGPKVGEKQGGNPGGAIGMTDHHLSCDTCVQKNFFALPG